MSKKRALPIFPLASLIRQNFIESYILFFFLILLIQSFLFKNFWNVFFLGQRDNTAPRIAIEV